MLMTLFLPVLENAANRVLSEELMLQASVSALEGKLIAAHVKGFNKTFYLYIINGQIELSPDKPVPADVTITAYPAGFIKLMNTDDVMSLLQSGDVEISGDARVGQQFRDLLSDMDLDWEELLAKKTGDIPAHQIGRTVRGLRSWLQRSVTSTRDSLADYLQEESSLLPMVDEVADYLQGVDALRSDVERLAARIRRLSVAQNL